MAAAAAGQRWRWLQLAVHWWLQVALVYSVVTSVVQAAEMCTKSVPVQREQRKVHVLRRVPASCSNWEKAWSWITKKDCGTKYRLDLVDLPSRKAITYRVMKVCCEGDTKCQEAQAKGLEASGLDVSDEKFLAIVLGSTAAALFVLVLVISISLCRKKKQCSLICEERRHIYANAEDAEESSELQGQKGCGGGEEEETEHKVCESEYAEITDSGLPRYTDIFKEAGGGEGVPDPFTKASAPPLVHYDTHRDPTPRQSDSAAIHTDKVARVRWADHARESDHAQSAPDHAHSAPDHAHSDPEHHNVREVLRSTATILQRGKGAEPSDHAHYYNLQGQGSGGGVRVKEEAVLSLTKDDPAVLTAPASSPPRPSAGHALNDQVIDGHAPNDQASNGHAPNNTSCVVNGDEDGYDQPLPPPPPPLPSVSEGSGKKGALSAYESLTARGDKEKHEYQRLIRRPNPEPDLDLDPDSLEVNGVSEDEEDSGVQEESCFIANGHSAAAAAAHC